MQGKPGETAVGAPLPLGTAACCASRPGCRIEKFDNSGPKLAEAVLKRKLFPQVTYTKYGTAGGFWGKVE